MVSRRFELRLTVESRNLFDDAVQARVLAGAKALRAPSHFHEGDEDAQQARVGGDGEARWFGLGIVAVHRCRSGTQAMVGGKRRGAGEEGQARAEGPEAALRPEVEGGEVGEDGRRCGCR